MNLRGAAVLSGMLVACGGGSASRPPASPSSSEAAGAVAEPTPAESRSEPTEAASADAASASAPPEPPKSESPSAMPRGTIVSEANDACTPVSVEFEKKVRPKFKACYAQGKKSDPNLMGTVKFAIKVDVKGRIKNTSIVENTLPDAVASCMQKAVRETPFPQVDKCWDATITLPVTFPTPH